ncbi:7444_t:CDS:2 [Entrophospora sp. SA101]|nr:10609_t:CDS:2 [Entrophospora sp. SA101]CAJ0900888.1 7444_t:CDS:2 [Entrophospora sp. SA101]
MSRSNDNNNEKIEVDLQTNLRRFDEQFSKEVKEIIDKIIPNKILELNRLFHQKDYYSIDKFEEEIDQSQESIIRMSQESVDINTFPNSKNIININDNTIFQEKKYLRIKELHELLEKEAHHLSIYCCKIRVWITLKIPSFKCNNNNDNESIISAMQDAYMSLPSIQRVFLESISSVDRDGHFVIVDGIQTFYKLSIPQNQHGLLEDNVNHNKPVIVCLHQVFGNLYTWKHQMQPLADATGCHVIAYDRPAFGFTERITQWEEGKNPYTQEAACEFLLKFLSSTGYGGRRFVFMGSSAGAAISSYVAIKYPQIVYALILIAPSLKAEDQGPPPISCTILGTFPGRLFLKAALYKNLPMLTLYNDVNTISDWETVVKPCYRTPLTLPNFYEAASYIMRYFIPLEILPHKHILQRLPILYITGENDKYTSFENHQQIFEDLRSNSPPNAILQFKGIAECGHLPQDEKPQEVLRLSIEFLRNLGL